MQHTVKMIRKILPNLDRDRSRPIPGYLEDCNHTGEDAVEVAPGVGVELAPKDLHSEQRHDEDTEHEEHEEGSDAGNGVDQGFHKVTHAAPVPVGCTT